MVVVLADSVLVVAGGAGAGVAEEEHDGTSTAEADGKVGRAAPWA